MMRSVFAAIASSLLLCATAHAGNVRLRVQSGFNQNVPVIGENIAQVAERVRTGGRSDVQLRIYDANKLVPTLQIFDAVASRSRSCPRGRSRRGR